MRDSAVTIEPGRGVALRRCGSRPVRRHCRRMAAETPTAPDTAPQQGDEPWDVRILALIDPGIDGTLIEENLRRTPTERLARMQAMLAFLEQSKHDGPERAEVAELRRRTRS